MRSERGCRKKGALADLDQYFDNPVCQGFHSILISIESEKKKTQAILNVWEEGHLQNGNEIKSFKSLFIIYFIIKIFNCFIKQVYFNWHKKSNFDIIFYNHLHRKI